ncbi:MAG: GNAT family protein [Pseudomonadota bacterium]
MNEAPLWPAPFTARHPLCAIRLLGRGDATDLAEASASLDRARLWYTSVPRPEEVADEIERRLSLMDAGTMLPFAVIDPRTKRAVGMTTYMNIDASNKRLEIGSTWYGASVQRTGLNTACKLLLLSQAFEVHECIAVEFRTHRLNRPSRAAIERLGAQLDGVLRNHMIAPDGLLRDTAVYSIISGEWPVVKRNLTGLLEGRTR